MSYLIMGLLITLSTYVIARQEYEGYIKDLSNDIQILKIENECLRKELELSNGK